MNDETVEASRNLSAQVDVVFELLADPTTHSKIDGTGWVQQAVDTQPLTELDQVFRMGMYHAKHPDGYYQVANKVSVLDPPHSIGWLTGEEQADGQLTFGGWLWRYDLAPLGPSETAVTLTYDWSAVPPHVREYIQFPPFAPDHLANSLRHFSELVASGSSTTQQSTT